MIAGFEAREIPEKSSVTSVTPAEKFQALGQLKVRLVVSILWAQFNVYINVCIDIHVLPMYIYIYICNVMHVQ